jgi:uncharacterized protein YlxW (UPF0749 family)
MSEVELWAQVKWLGEDLARERSERQRLEKLLDERQRKLLDLHDEVVRLTARLNEAKGHGRDRGKASVKRGFGSNWEDGERAARILNRPK